MVHHCTLNTKTIQNHPKTLNLPVPRNAEFCWSLAEPVTGAGWLGVGSIGSFGLGPIPRSPTTSRRSKPEEPRGTDIVNCAPL